ncbi:MAG: acyl-CoA thioesterase [Alphaproteobacteria bacterium]|jgi:acyl-CoA thioester hydrolase|nr:acyl-CoA thioesterase [Alphaproteobacteria bacterium]MDP6591406.1 acyl-CoA thioesterase [Alphaproteobacteria bacterium]MDP6817127.1 acyl-CoA thioesterase [Alphaproteobacteria bacterium]
MKRDPFEPFIDLEERPDIVAEFNIEPGWRFALARRALFAELDALSHLNHTTFLRYFEDARIGYMMHHGLTAPAPDSTGCVLARLDADYKQPVFFDERLVVTVRAAKIGNTSILLEYGAWSAEKGLTCQSTSLLVMVVTVTGEKERISDAMRASIADFEGREF